MSSPEWNELLGRLRGEVPELVRRFTEEFQQRGLYDFDAVHPDDLRETAGETFEMLLARLAGDDTHDGRVPEELGVRRARQGVPIGALLDAVRIDFQILWRMMNELVDPASARVLVDNVERLHTVVEEYISEVQQAFLRETAILQSDARLATERYLARLFNLSAPSESFVDEVAAELKVDPHAYFEALSVPSESVGRAQRALSAQLAGGDIYSYGYRGTLFLFRPQGSHASSWPRDYADLPSLYLDAIPGLAAVPQVARASVAIHDANPNLMRLVQFEDVWGATATTFFENLLPGFTDRFLDGLGHLSDYDRDRLTATVRAYLHTGSVKRTAEEVFCHRNTVINRLRQFESLTGIDVTIPARGALAHVLLSHRYPDSSPAERRDPAKK